MDLSPDLGTAGTLTVYAIVFGFVFVESGLLVGFALPGDTILFGAGLLAAQPSSGVNVVVLALGAFVAAVSGDSLGYATGARLGRPWLQRKAARSPRLARQLDRAERFYARFGWWAVVSARWIPWVRTFVPLLAGASAMRYRDFVSANLVGATCWAIGLTVLGYAVGSR